jgi:hypothetical protein
MGVLQDHKHRSLSGDQFGIEPIGAKKGHTYAVFGQGVCSDFLMISRSNSALCGASHKADDAERVIMRSVVAGVLSQLGSDGGALRIIPGHGGG